MSGFEAELYAADARRRAAENGPRNALDVMVRDWDAMRRALESAALTLHELHGGAGVRLAECSEPQCVYRSGLLDRTGGSAPDPAPLPH